MFKLLVTVLLLFIQFINGVTINMRITINALNVVIRVFGIFEVVVSVKLSSPLKSLLGILMAIINVRLHVVGLDINCFPELR